MKSGPYWLGTPTENKYNRIKADLEGTTVTINGNTYNGKRFKDTGSTETSLTAYLEKYVDSSEYEIRESFVEIKYNGKYIDVNGNTYANYHTEDSDSFEIKAGDSKLEIIYTIQKK